MAKRKKKAPSISEYERLCMRVQQAINTPQAQLEGSVTALRAEDERPEDWERMLEDLDTVEEVTVTRLREGEVQLSWTPALDDE